MNGRTIIGVGLGTLLGLGCGGLAQSAADTDTDTDTDTEGGGGETRGETSGGDASAGDPTADSMSAGATSSDPTSATTSQSADGTEGSGDATEGSGDASAGSGETGECPIGAEGCLCDVGATCERGLECNEEGTCVGPGACRPIDDEPHDDEASAIEIDGVGCDAGMDLGVIGTVEGPQTDWYRFAGDDAAFCPEQPVAIAAADEALQVCVFLECDNGGDVQDLVCGKDTTEADSPQGRPGCCGEGLAFIEGYDCSGFGGKDAGVFISVGSEDAVCVDYGLEYGF